MVKSARLDLWTLVKPRIDSPYDGFEINSRLKPFFPIDAAPAHVEDPALYEFFGTLAEHRRAIDCVNSGDFASGVDSKLYSNPPRDAGGASYWWINQGTMGFENGFIRKLSECGDREDRRH
jgi:hypothetical protein